MSPRLKRRLTFLGGFLLYFGVLWTLWDTVLIYPLKIFVVFLHEISHAMAAVATGGSVVRILLDPYQGGAAYTVGGNHFIILSAGYLGSLLWGAAFVMLAFSRRVRPRWVLGSVGVLVLLLTLLLVRSWFGFGFGLVFGAALLASARYLKDGVNRVFLMGLGLTSALYAILDIKSDVLDRSHLPSDAAMLAEMTGVPTAVWGLLWIAIALLVSAWLLRWAARRWERGEVG
jgi:hypothetical protein